ncbi:hypothetical protein T439DRAFT_352693 [Meredithblackwellia eburnea MCA 4105]
MTGIPKPPQHRKRDSSKKQGPAFRKRPHPTLEDVRRATESCKTRIPVRLSNQDLEAITTHTLMPYLFWHLQEGGTASRLKSGFVGWGKDGVCLIISSTEAGKDFLKLTQTSPFALKQTWETFVRELTYHGMRALVGTSRVAILQANNFETKQSKGRVFLQESGNFNRFSSMMDIRQTRPCYTKRPARKLSPTETSTVPAQDSDQADDYDTDSEMDLEIKSPSHLFQYTSSPPAFAWKGYQRPSLAPYLERSPSPTSCPPMSSAPIPWVQKSVKKNDGSLIRAVSSLRAILN